MIFFLTLTVRGPSTGSILIEKIMGYGVDLEKKRKLCFQSLTKERKQPPVVIL